jgi:cytochrome c oxidase cbb3-type subunit 3
MSDQKTDSQYDQPIAGHSYDGISELDNPLPMWWLWTFYGTIIFAFIYYIHFELAGGPTSDEYLKHDLAQIEASKGLAPKNEISDSTLAAAMEDKNKIEQGKAIYALRCASCHNEKGQGQIGPNLTDKFWIHGSKPSEVLLSISKGVLDKGMPPWEGVLKSDELLSVVSFIHSLRGSNPTNPKAPQGTEVPDYY